MVDAPVHKPKITTKQIYIAGAGAGVCVLYIFWQRSRSTPVTDTLVAPDGTQVTDGSYTTDDSYSAATGTTSGVAGSAYGYYDAATGSFVSGQGTTTNLITTNSQWAQQASTLLSSHGYDQATVDAALGAFLGNSGLSTEQYQIVQAAIGQSGYPPVSVPSPHVATNAGQTATTPAINVKKDPTQEQARAANPTVNALYHKYLEAANVYTHSKKAADKTKADNAMKAYQSAYNAYVASKRGK